MAESTCTSRWRSQFKIKNFLLNYDDVSSFHKSRWSECVLPMAVFRTTLFLYTLSIQIYSPIYFKLGAKFIIYATYWGYLTLVVGLFVSSVNAWIYYAQSYENDTEVVSWRTKLQWVVRNVYTSAAFCVTIIYWGLIFNGDIEFANFNTHAVNLFIVLIEFFTSRAPVRLLHFYQPTLFFLVYSTFTIVYWKAGGTNVEGHPYIYKVIDYNTNLTTGIVLMFATTFIAIPAVHLIVFVLYTVRESIWRLSTTKRVAASEDDKGNVQMN